MHSSNELSGIEGRDRVEAAQTRLGNGRVERVARDGTLLNGRFVPESSLVRLSRLGLDPAGSGPRVDQLGRYPDPAYFVAGNLLRSIETADWLFHEGRRMAGLLAADLRAELPIAAPGIVIGCSNPPKLCVPQRLLDDSTPGLAHLQLRMSEVASECLRTLTGDRPVREYALSRLPERRLLMPLAVPRPPLDTRRLEIAFLVSSY